MALAVILATIVIGPPQNGTTVRVPPGATLVVRLPGNVTTGYSWLVGRAGGGLRLTSSQYVQSKPVRVGSGGTFVFRFDVHAGGVLQLVYRRPWEKRARPARTYRVTVSTTRHSSS